MTYTCKCGSKNVTVHANKRGALVGKCADCRKFGNYGKQFEASKEADAEKAIGDQAGKAPKDGSAKPARTSRAKRTGAKRKANALGRDRQPLQRAETSSKAGGSRGSFWDFLGL